MAPLVSPRSPYGGDLSSNALFQSILGKYTNNWGATIVNQGMEDIIAALQAMSLPGQEPAATTAAPTTIIKERGGGGGRNDRGRMVGGYPAPGPGGYNVPRGGQRSDSGWALPLAALGGNDAVERATREARRAVRDGGGTYSEPGRERTRERSRTHTSRDGTTTTTTNVNVSRNGGTAVAVDSGNDGNQQRRKKKSRGDF